MKKIIGLLILAIVLSFGTAEAADVTLKLSIWDRINIRNILPMQNDYQTGLTIRDVRDKVKPTPAEIQKYCIIDIPTGRGTTTEWDPIKAKGYEITITFTGSEMQIIQDAFQKLSDEKRLLTGDMSLDLYKKIMKSK